MPHWVIYDSFQTFCMHAFVIWMHLISFSAYLDDPQAVAKVPPKKPATLRQAVAEIVDAGLAYKRWRGGACVQQRR